MPVLSSNYTCTGLNRNGCWQTIASFLRRKRVSIQSIPDIVETSDGDQIETHFFSCGDSKKLLIITHGLESHGRDQYLLTTADYMRHQGYSTLTWSMRTCGKVMNRTKWCYNAFDYADLELLVNNYSQKYESIVLMGFSLGASITAHFLSRSSTIEKVEGAFLVSPPLDLDDFYKRINKPFNHFIFQKRIVKSIKRKFAEKYALVDMDDLDYRKIEAATTIGDIEEHVFAPLYGYSDGADYRKKASAISVLSGITKPVYILSAKNDPFLGDENHPVDLAQASKYIHLELTNHGGHMSFLTGDGTAPWYLHRLKYFVTKIIK